MSYEALGRLPDPTTTPAGPGFISQAIVPISPGMVHPLNSGGTISVKIAGDFWSITLGYPRLTIEEGGSIFPFLYSLQNSFTNFYVQLPTYANPTTGAWTGAVPSSGDVSGIQGQKSFQISNWTSHTTIGDDLSIGDMIKFSNHHKIYMISTKSVDTGLNVATFGLSSEIVLGLAAATIEPNDIKFRVRIQGGIPTPTLRADGMYEPFTISLKENII